MSSAPVVPKPLLSARRLKIQYPLPRSWLLRPKGSVRAIDDVHFNLFAGETLAIVGEQGAGKTALARALGGLQGIAGGGISYGSHDLARVTKQGWRPLRREIQLLDADSARGLPGRTTVQQMLLDPLRVLCPEMPDSERQARVAEILQAVGLKTDQAQLNRKQLSEEERHRVALARALIVRPRVLVTDEPGGSLDGHARAALLDLIAGFQRTLGFAWLLLTRDLQQVRAHAHRVVVLYLGKIMEQGPATEVFEDPRHPYTRSLLTPGAAPVTPSEPITSAAPPSGCVYRLRCGLADAHCALEAPYQRRVGSNVFAACHYLDGVRESDLLPQMRGRPAAGVAAS